MPSKLLIAIISAVSALPILLYFAPPFISLAFMKNLEEIFYYHYKQIIYCKTLNNYYHARYT
jgi:hypothetical protein